MFHNFEKEALMVLSRQDIEDICVMYRDAKDKELQITIISELYLISAKEVKKILSDSYGY